MSTHSAAAMNEAAQEIHTLIQWSVKQTAV